MTIEQELDAFVTFARGQLADDTDAGSLDALFDRWRLENPPPESRDEDVAAIAASLEDFRRGERGVPARDTSAALHSELDERG